MNIFKSKKESVFTDVDYRNLYESIYKLEDRIFLLENPYKFKIGETVMATYLDRKGHEITVTGTIIKREVIRFGIRRKSYTVYIEDSDDTIMPYENSIKPI